MESVVGRADLGRREEARSLMTFSIARSDLAGDDYVHEGNDDDDQRIVGDEWKESISGILGLKKH